MVENSKFTNTSIRKGENSDFDKQVENFYHSKEWKRFRILAFEKHGFLCTMCVKYGEERPRLATLIHHIVEVRYDFSKRFDIDNVTPLCEACHNRVHSDIKANHTTAKPKKTYAVIV